MKPAFCRELVKHLQVVWGVSMRRACTIVDGSRSSLYYRHKRDAQAILRQRIREIAETRVRWGYRRIHVLLKREGWRINAKRVHRVLPGRAAATQQDAQAQGLGQAAQ